DPVTGPIDCRGGWRQRGGGSRWRRRGHGGWSGVEPLACLGWMTAASDQEGDGRPDPRAAEPSDRAKTSHRTSNGHLQRKYRGPPQTSRNLPTSPGSARLVFDGSAAAAGRAELRGHLGGHLAEIDLLGPGR